MAHTSQPELHLPVLHLPDMRLSDLKVPELNMPDIDVHALTRLGRPARRRRNLLPWIFVGSVGAAAAGWFIATSSMTGPRVRAAVTRLRGRLNTLRNGWHWNEQTEESTERFWSSEDGWRREASHRGQTPAGGPSDDPNGDPGIAAQGPSPASS